MRPRWGHRRAPQRSKELLHKDYKVRHLNCRYHPYYPMTTHLCQKLSPLHLRVKAVVGKMMSEEGNERSQIKPIETHAARRLVHFDAIIFGLWNSSRDGRFDSVMTTTHAQRACMHYLQCSCTSRVSLTKCTVCKESQSNEKLWYVSYMYVNRFSFVCISRNIYMNFLVHC